MKKLLLLLACTAAAVGLHASCSAATSSPDQRPRTVKGTGRLAVRTVQVQPFREVETSRGVQIVLTEGIPGQATITADDNLLEFVFVRSVGERLIAGIDPEVESISNPHIVITLPTDGDIRLLKTSSGSGIESQCVLSGSELRLNASSASRIHVEADINTCVADASSGAGIEARLRAKDCTAHVTSGARIELSGTADRSRAEAGSGGNYNGRNLTATQCTVQASSGANASVHCTDRIDAHASSGGHITYTGTCTGNTTTSSGGTIRKR